MIKSLRFFPVEIASSIFFLVQHNNAIRNDEERWKESKYSLGFVEDQSFLLCKYEKKIET